MSYNIYQNDILIATVDTLTHTLNGLLAGTSYKFEVTETDGADVSSKSNSVSVTTNGVITIPSINEIEGIYFSTDSIGIELDGFDTSGQFGGTEPIRIEVLATNKTTSSQSFEVAIQYHMNNQKAELVENKHYLIIDGNKSMIIKMK
ncbi:hypothetical protein [Vagococcus xieshaowenii]|uniref:Baseplate upper protein immunoglobulin like domain-containing protein n=1 Tax=Vagococcus xieshaowenii TaxID=2562451 RepID=A0AAJ5EEM8_9ENTE|nr:hypothetical protein [Vagococcus xieshaowenii]QCA28264.1 hypothetical protein E4Z98_02640 [Vagococcus xieshaowenii]TFZ41919.1 hypothetical protein E4031_04820 [Vagococcus xieshaowenii]